MFYALGFIVIVLAALIQEGKTWALRVLIVLAAALIWAAAPASAADHLGAAEAKHALRSEELALGMEEVRVPGCTRLSPTKLKCEAIETGPWNETIDAHEVHSFYAISERATGYKVWWLDFVYGPAHE